MAVVLRIRLTRRLLAAVPPLAATLLWWRRRRGEARISRILTTTRAVERHYGIVPESVAVSSAAKVSLTTVRGARVMAQPAAVVGADWSLLWPYAPLLRRRPYGVDFIWKRFPEQRGHLRRTLYAGADGFSYYHWLTGTVPKILAAQCGGDPNYDAYLVNPRHKGKENFQTEMLRILGVKPEQTVWLERRTHVLCDELTLPPEPCVDEQTRLLPWARELLRAAFMPHVKGGAASLPEKIFISRAKARRRRLVDESQLEAVLHAQGYVSVYLEDLPFLDQVRLFMRAREIVALHGAGLTNLVFSAPGARVVEIIPDAWRNPCFANLAALGGIDYKSVIGQCVERHRGFASDVRVPQPLALTLSRAGG